VTEPPLVEYRCPDCDRLICKVTKATGLEVEARCPRCKSLTRAQLADENETR
jgi:phage FluMu protein Com